MKSKLSRRDLLKLGGTGILGLPLFGMLRDTLQKGPESPASHEGEPHEGTDPHASNGAVGRVDHERNGFNPADMLYDFDYGTVSQMENGQTLREYQFYALDKEIEIAPGVFFPGWVYGSPTSPESVRAGRLVGRVPGPTIRCVEGDRIRITFTNTSPHPHTIHFHGIHSARMDGVPGQGDGLIHQGESTVYEFDAAPFGCHLYHCHAFPLARHIHKGLYGGFIIDPDPEKYEGEEREVAKTRNHLYPENQEFHEMFMMMNAFDTNFDKANEVYAANTVAFGYHHAPIALPPDKDVRVYLVNITEFDPINSLHLHANFFDYYDHGTTLTPTLRTVDTIMQSQAQRGILEFSYQGFEPGLYMFHAHQSEFAELGWTGNFQVGGEA